jgi:hypothetical protein
MARSQPDTSGAPLVSSGNTFGPPASSNPVYDCPCGVSTTRLPHCEQSR